MAKLLSAWLALYCTKAEALRALNKGAGLNVRSNRLYEWLKPDPKLAPPEIAKLYMRQCIIESVLEGEGISGLTRRQLNRIVNKLS